MFKPYETLLNDNLKYIQQWEETRNRLTNTIIEDRNNTIIKKEKVLDICKSKVDEIKKYIKENKVKNYKSNKYIGLDKQDVKHIEELLNKIEWR